MFMRRVLVLGAISFAVAANMAACVGDDPALVSSGKTPGERLGPCFADGKCKEGLVCRDGEICLNPDEPKPVSDAGGDANGTTNDDGGIVGNDSGTDAPAVGCTPTAITKEGPQCGGVPPCSNGMVCCPSTPSRCDFSSPTTCPDQSYWGCESNEQCVAANGVNGLTCCIFSNLNQTDGVTSCSAKSGSGTSQCMQDTNCNGGRRACTSDNDCLSQSCRFEEITTRQGFSVVIKVCAPTP
jgi:hypothetical protein